MSTPITNVVARFLEGREGHSGRRGPGNYRFYTDGNNIYSYRWNYRLAHRDAEGAVHFDIRMFEPPYSPTTRQHMDETYAGLKHLAVEQSVPDVILNDLVNSYVDLARGYFGATAPAKAVSILKARAPRYHAVDWEAITQRAYAQANGYVHESGKITSQINRYLDRFRLEAARTALWQRCYRNEITWDEYKEQKKLLRAA